VTDAVSGSAPGTVHGGLLATFADAASAISTWDAYDPETERRGTTDMCALSLSLDICNHRKSTSAISECRGKLVLVPRG